jgi:hypothetical protein
MRSRVSLALGLAAAGAAAIVLAGCFDAFDQKGSPNAPPVVTNPTWEANIRPRIMQDDAHCLMCHSITSGNHSGYQATGYALDTYAQAVGPDGNNEFMVKPGDAENSPLIWRLEGSHGVLVTMPLDGWNHVSGQKAPADFVQLFRNWIDQGARER